MLGVHIHCEKVNTPRCPATCSGSACKHMYNGPRGCMSEHRCIVFWATNNWLYEWPQPTQPCASIPHQNLIGHVTATGDYTLPVIRSTTQGFSTSKQGHHHTYCHSFWPLVCLSSSALHQQHDAPFTTAFEAKQHRTWLWLQQKSRHRP